MLTRDVMHSMFQSGGEAYSYDEIRNWCIAQYGLTEHQIKGVVGYLVGRGMLYVATRATKKQSAVFVR